MDYDPIPADLLFAEPANMPYASYARRERSEIMRSLCLFDDDVVEYHAARHAKGLLHSRGQ